MKYGLDPIVNDNAKLIILGSLPGELSLKKQEYYAHPQNQFWRIICAILNEDLPSEYSKKCDILLKHNIALWDVIHFAEREGSLDSNIKNAVPNNFDSFFMQYPNIKRVVLNGDKAAKLFHKHFSRIDVQTVTVASTSPARANLTFEQKLLRWKEAVN